jgi:hypothetical protein
MTPARQDLIAALGQIQNHPMFAHQDIMTITGCGMSDDEVRTHIESCFVGIEKFNFEKANEEPRRRARKSRAA